MDEIHVHKTKKSICAHFAESPCKLNFTKAVTYVLCYFFFSHIHDTSCFNRKTNFFLKSKTLKLVNLNFFQNSSNGLPMPQIKNKMLIYIYSIKNYPSE